MYKYTEDNLIEQPTKQLFEELGYEVMDCLDEKVGENINSLLSSPREY